MNPRETDALIAINIFGCNPVHTTDYLDTGSHEWLACRCENKHFKDHKIPSFSESISDAFLIVEKMPAVMLTKYTTGKYNCGIGMPVKLYEAEADTAPMAIAKAALKALGVQYE